MFRTEAALRYAHPEAFVNSTNERATAAEIVAGDIREKAFYFFREHNRTEKETIDFTISMGIVLKSVVEDGLLPDVIKQLQSKEPLGFVKYIEEVHMSNEYYCVVRAPEHGKAEKLLAIQRIPANTQTNGDHNHKDPRRSEVMYSLAGRLPVELLAYPDGPVVKDEILLPGDYILIYPDQSHKVKSSSSDSVNIVVGMPLKEDEFIPQAA